MASRIFIQLFLGLCILQAISALAIIPHTIKNDNLTGAKEEVSGKMSLLSEETSEDTASMNNDPLCMLKDIDVQGYADLKIRICTATSNASNVKCIPQHIYYVSLPSGDFIETHLECVNKHQQSCEPFFQKKTYFEGTPNSTTITVGSCFQESCSCPDDNEVNYNWRYHFVDVVLPDSRVVPVKNTTLCRCTDTCHRVSKFDENGIDVGECRGEAINVCLPYFLQQVKTKDEQKDFFKNWFTRSHQCKSTSTCKLKVIHLEVETNVTVIQDCQCQFL